MQINVSEEFLTRLLSTIRPCADACELNGPAFYMLAQEVAGYDIDIEDITLGELAACYTDACKRYNIMCQRLEIPND